MIIDITINKLNNVDLANKIKGALDNPTIFINGELMNGKGKITFAKGQDICFCVDNANTKIFEELKNKFKGLKITKIGI